MALLTDWFRVATAGPTIDGRDISEQDLVDMAELYDTEEYTASLWDNHFRYWKFGSVHDVKYDKDTKGRGCLYARLKPNGYYLNANKSGQLEHFSIEIVDNFAGTGKAYLGGLAITDEPASLGTSAAKLFSAQPGTKRIFTQPLKSDKPTMMSDGNDETPSEGQMLNFFKKLFKNEPQTSSPEKETAMNKEQADKLDQSIDKLTTTVEALSAQFSQQKPTSDDSDGGDDSSTDPKVAQESDTSKEFNQLKKDFEEFKSSHKTLEKDHKELQEKFNKLSNEPSSDTTEPDGGATSEQITC